jgi:hypothetical protein
MPLGPGKASVFLSLFFAAASLAGAGVLISRFMNDKDLNDRLRPSKCFILKLEEGQRQCIQKICSSTPWHPVPIALNSIPSPPSTEHSNPMLTPQHSIESGPAGPRRTAATPACGTFATTPPPSASSTQPSPSTASRPASSAIKYTPSRTPRSDPPPQPNASYPCFYDLSNEYTVRWDHPSLLPSLLAAAVTFILGVALLLYAVYNISGIRARQEYQPVGEY